MMKLSITAITMILLTGLATSSQAAVWMPPNDSSLVVHYSFENNLHNSVADRDHATSTANAQYAGNGVFGTTAAMFPGNYYIQVNNTSSTLDNLSNFTVQAWYKAQIDPADLGILVSHYGGSTGWILWSNTQSLAGQAEFRVHDGTRSFSSGNADPLTSAWHQVVGVLDGTTMKLYVDGYKVSENTYASINYATPLNHIPLRIGAPSWTNHAESAQFAMTGYIDEVAVWSRALADEEIELLYYNGQLPAPAIPAPLAVFAVTGLMGFITARRDVREQ